MTKGPLIFSKFQKEKKLAGPTHRLLEDFGVAKEMFDIDLGVDPLKLKEELLAIEKLRLAVKTAPSTENYLMLNEKLKEIDDLSKKLRSELTDKISKSSNGMAEILKGAIASINWNISEMKYEVRKSTTPDNTPPSDSSLQAKP